MMGERKGRGWKCEEGEMKGGGEGRKGGVMGRREGRTGEEGTGERDRGGRDLYLIIEHKKNNYNYTSFIHYFAL